MESDHPITPPPGGGQLLQLFSRHDRALRAYARTILPSIDEIDEVMQEASVIIWEQQEQLRRAEEFLPWAKVIVRNVSFRHRRRLLRDRHVFDDSLVEQLLLEEEQEETDASREYNALMHCLNQLPDQRRELILAPYRGPGAVKELAAQTSRSANSFYKVLQRLRAKLLTCVETELQKEARI